MLNRFKIGHYTDLVNVTGCTVIIPDGPVVASASALGASPGSREYALLSPKRKIQRINALLLTGGSAFGLSAATGIVEELEKLNMGYNTNYGNVPIVPAGVIFDLNIGSSKIRPGVDEGRQAFLSAIYNNSECGNFGAGTGATIGKWAGLEFAMKGGLGVATINHGNLSVSCLVVVNSVGDIIDVDGKILAGARNPDGTFKANESKQQRWGAPVVGMAENTVLCAAMTNAKIDKQQAAYIADRSHHGIARRIEPSHTSYDGDISFVMSTCEVDVPLDIVTMIIISCTETAILNGIKSAETLEGIPGLKNV